MKQRDRDRLDAGVAENDRECAHLRLVEWLDNCTPAVEPFFNLVAPPPRNEWCRFFVQRLIEARHADSTQFENVAKPFGRHQRGLGTLTFQDGVSGDSRGVQHLLQVIRSQVARQRLDAFDDGARIVLRGRWNLAGRQLAVLGEAGNVSKRSSDIGRYAQPATHQLHRYRASRASSTSIPSPGRFSGRMAPSRTRNASLMTSSS